MDEGKITRNVVGIKLKAVIFEDFCFQSSSLLAFPLFLELVNMMSLNFKFIAVLATWQLGDLLTESPMAHH